MESINFSHSVVCHLVLLAVSFDLQKVFSFIKSHILSITVSVLLVFFSESFLLCQCNEGYYPLFKNQIQCIWFYIDIFDSYGLQSCVLCLLINMDTLALFYLQPSSLTSTFFLKMLSVFLVCIFYFFIKNQLSTDVWIYVKVFSHCVEIVYQLQEFPGGFETVLYISSVNNDPLTSSFPIFIPFIYISSLIAPAKTLSPVLNRH